VNGNGAAFTYCLPCGLRHMGIHVNSVNRVVNQVMCALNRRTEPAVALHPAGADGEDEIERKNIGTARCRVWRLSSGLTNKKQDQKKNSWRN
jgi:hypothetical protein